METTYTGLLCQEYSIKDCGLGYSPVSQMVRSHVKKLASKIDVLDQAEEGLHQQKGA